jgi:hypothetical protein
VFAAISPVAVFVGREVQLDKMCKALRGSCASGTPCRLALVGPEGCGKTAILGELSRRVAPTPGPHPTLPPHPMENSAAVPAAGTLVVVNVGPAGALGAASVLSHPMSAVGTAPGAPAVPRPAPTNKADLLAFATAAVTRMATGPDGEDVPVPKPVAAPPVFTDGVVWVSGKSPITVHRSFRALAADVLRLEGAQRQLTDDGVREQVYAWMRTRTACLLIVDDADASTAAAVGR